MATPEHAPDATALVPGRLAGGLAVAALVVPQAVLVLVQGAAPLLLREAPLLLLALHPFAPWSLLVAARTDLLTFTLITVAVRTVPALGGYLVGRWYGPAALDRLTRRRAARPARPSRRLRVPARLSRAGPGVLLVAYPGATASVLSGASGLRPRVFLPLMWAGLTLGAVANRAVAAVAQRPLAALADVVTAHAGVLGAVLLAGTAVAALLRRWWRGRP